MSDSSMHSWAAISYGIGRIAIFDRSLTNVFRGGTETRVTALWRSLQGREVVPVSGETYEIPTEPPEYPPVCEFCGLAIPRDGRECPSLDSGRCRP
jgi:hypothetical protein